MIPPAAAATTPVPQRSPGSDKPKSRNLDTFTVELNKFIREDCVVTIMDGTVIEGKLVAYSQNHLNVIVMTETEKILVKQLSHIRRKRNARELPISAAR